MKSKAKELSTGEEQEECGIRTLDGKSVQKEKANQPESKRRATDSEEEKNRRIAITFAFVTVFLVASFVTITLFQTIQATKRYFYPRQQFSKMEDIFEEYLPDIVVINGILNPFVYFFTDTHFKVEAIKLCVYLMNGERHVQVENINATRCNVENEYDGNFLTFLYYAFVFVAAFTCIILIVIFQVKIRKALVKKAKTKKQMKSKAKELSTGEEQEECGIRTLDGKSVQKKKTNQPESKRRATDSEEEKNRRIAITFAFVTVFLVTSFVTITLFQTTQAIKRYFYPRQQISKMEDIFEEYLPDIVVINGIMNPFVYFFTDAQFKEEVMKLCRRKV
ncbi:uncharacterized protein LOC133195274 [Saccostrea echinata]|uniref:uncharacterized protein LOC133195274 n=1 Tax=Saccostrea echinata TaxID=191078 RepID=UPI002A804557|nr:uncharacterized protein LOC133195274 [Saccostrea echinata]